MGRIIKRTAAQAARGAIVDKNKLGAVTETDLARHAVEDGEGSDSDYSEHYPSPAQLRQKLGLTQHQLAELLGLPVATWQNWEQGRTVIDAPGRALLFILQREPEAVLRALKKEAA
jgi:putative transcriptional regulator